MTNDETHRLYIDVDHVISFLTNHINVHLDAHLIFDIYVVNYATRAKYG